MKSLLILASFLMSMLHPAQSSAQNFTGTLTMHLFNEEGQITEVQYHMKSSNVRMDFHGKNQDAIISLILNRDAQKALVIIETLRMQMEVSAEVFSNQNHYANSSDTGATAEKTGRRKNIAGESTEEWQLFNDTGEKSATIWVPTSSKIRTIHVSTNSHANSGQNSWVGSIPSDQLFPFEIVDRDGRTIMKVAQVQSRRLEDSLFAVPAGFFNVSINLDE